MEMKDVSGQPRPDAEVEAALLFVKKRIIKPTMTDPELIIQFITIKEALEELLDLRAKIRGNA